MRKIIIIIVLGIIVSGCSATRIINNGVYESPIPVSGNLIENIKNQNITASGFFIQKMEIEVVTSEGKNKFIGTIKFRKPDRYLISIKSRTGIEGARIYMSGDSILVNDRINKKLYYGTSIYLVKKYGFSQSFLPLILGDLILAKNCEDSLQKCSGNELKIDCKVKGVSLAYNIDCKKRKVILVDQINNFAESSVTIKYDNFLNVGNKLIPKVIEYIDKQHNTTVKLKIMKVEFPWDGMINFVPGKGYELIELV